MDMVFLPHPSLTSRCQGCIKNIEQSTVAMTTTRVALGLESSFDKSHTGKHMTPIRKACKAGS